MKKRKFNMGGMNMPPRGAEAAAAGMARRPARPMPGMRRPMPEEAAEMAEEGMARRPAMPERQFKKGGSIDGIAKKGKTRGKMV